MYLHTIVTDHFLCSRHIVYMLDHLLKPVLDRTGGQHLCCKKPH